MLQKRQQKTAQSPLRHLCFHVHTATGGKYPQNTSEHFLPLFHQFIRSFLYLFWLRSSPSLHKLLPSNPTPAVGVSSDRYVEAQDISQNTMGESRGQSEKTPRPRKRREVIRKELSKAGAQAPAPGKSLSLPFTLQANVVENHQLCKKLKPVPCSVPRSYCWSLELDTSDEEQISSSGPGSDEPRLDRSCGHCRDADYRKCQAGHNKHQVELANFGGVISSKLSLHGLRFSSFYSSLTVPYCHSVPV